MIVEALAVGTPVVSTDCPSGPAEILGFGRWGRLVPVDDATAMATAVLGGLASCRGIGVERARLFSPPRVAQEYLRIMGLE